MCKESEIIEFLLGLISQVKVSVYHPSGDVPMIDKNVRRAQSARDWLLRQKEALPVESSHVEMEQLQS